MENFCKKWNVSIVDVSDSKLIDTLLELRNFLNHILNDLCTKNTIYEKDIDKINRYLTCFSFYTVLKKEDKSYYLSTVPDKFNSNQLIFEIISSFIEIITDYDIERIKLCKNPECKWIFYDESRSHTRKWCDNTCATLMKVRRFRKKQTIKNSRNL